MRTVVLLHKDCISLSYLNASEIVPLKKVYFIFDDTILREVVIAQRRLSLQTREHHSMAHKAVPFFAYPD